MSVVIENPQPPLEDKNDETEEVELKLVAQDHGDKEPIPVEEIPADNSKLIW